MTPAQYERAGSGWSGFLDRMDERLADAWPAAPAVSAQPGHEGCRRPDLASIRCSPVSGVRVLSERRP